MRRDPPFEAVLPAYLGALTGAGTLIPGAVNICPSVKSVTIASLGAAGTAVFSQAGSPFATLAVPANGSNSLSLAGYELGSGSGLDVTTSASMDVSALYSIVDHTPGITKSAARAAAYQASLLAPKAIRAPNLFGGQTQG